MKRRIVLATCLLGIVAGSAGAALASPNDGKNHNVCIMLAKNENYNAADYICFSTPNP